MRAFRSAAATSILLLAACSRTGPAASPAHEDPATARAAHEVSAKDFDPRRFSRPTVIDNIWLPMRPGMHYVWKGHAIDGGARVERRVVSTVTDVTKVIDGVRTLVVWERDFTAGYLEENEIAFFAQDDDGNVWHFGEYPEEYNRRGQIEETPAWIAGLHGARPGIAMQATPRRHAPSYAQGWGPEVHWNDRARVYRTGVRTCVPIRCYGHVLVVDEFNRDEPGTHQLKYYAPGVGNVRVGWRGRNEEEREVLELVRFVRLGGPARRSVQSAVLVTEERAYRSSTVYGLTRPARPSA